MYGTKSSHFGIIDDGRLSVLSLGPTSSLSRRRLGSSQAARAGIARSVRGLDMPDVVIERAVT